MKTLGWGWGRVAWITKKRLREAMMVSEVGLLLPTQVLGLVIQ